MHHAWHSIDYRCSGYQTGQEDLACLISRRRMAEEVPGRLALRLAVDTRTGRRPDSNPCWKRRPRRPRHTLVRQVEIDAGVSADEAWDTAVDRCQWRALRPQLVSRSWWWWWCSGYSTGLNQQSCSTQGYYLDGGLTVWLQIGKLSWYVTNHLGQLYFPSLQGK